jgi:hypothetical protein
MAAVLGDSANQKAVIPFIPAKDGTATLWSFDTNKDAATVRADLDKFGVQYRTLVPHANGTQVYVFDPSNELHGKMEQVGAHYGQIVNHRTGNGEFLGGDTREEGHAKYHEVIVNYERFHEPYRGRHGKVAGALIYSDGRAEAEEIIEKDWVTINGTHVLIGEDGRIAQGPASMRGKKPSELRSKPVSGQQDQAQRIADAKANYNGTNGVKRAVVDKFEKKICDATGLKHVGDSEPFDGVGKNGKVGVEIKCVFQGAKNDKVTMHPSSMARKMLTSYSWEQQTPGTWTHEDFSGRTMQVSTDHSGAFRWQESKGSRVTASGDGTESLRTHLEAKQGEPDMRTYAVTVDLRDGEGKPKYYAHVGLGSTRFGRSETIKLKDLKRFLR